MNEEEIKVMLQSLASSKITLKTYDDVVRLVDLCTKLQKELDKKDKVINLIAESWKQDDIRSVEEIKEYFYKKAEGENE